VGEHDRADDEADEQHPAEGEDNVLSGSAHFKKASQTAARLRENRLATRQLASILELTKAVHVYAAARSDGGVTPKPDA
jgi:hypothetical protein